MLIKIILSSMLLLSSQVYADNLNKIFDIDLGSQVDESKPSFISNEKSKNAAIYKIDFKGFNNVRVNYTPTTKKIYSIVAYKKASSDCNSEAELIAGILSKRYGELTNNDRILDDIYSIQSGNKSLMVGCHGFMDKTLMIVLSDDDLRDLNKKEEIDIEAAKEENNF